MKTSRKINLLVAQFCVLNAEILNSRMIYSQSTSERIFRTGEAALCTDHASPPKSLSRLVAAAQPRFIFAFCVLLIHACNLAPTPLSIQLLGSRPRPSPRRFVLGSRVLLVCACTPHSPFPLLGFRPPLLLQSLYACFRFVRAA